LTSLAWLKAEWVSVWVCECVNVCCVVLLAERWRDGGPLAYLSCTCYNVNTCSCAMNEMCIVFGLWVVTEWVSEWVLACGVLVPRTRLVMICCAGGAGRGGGIILRPYSVFYLSHSYNICFFIFILN
jgi:hypothetical protein